MVIPYTMKQSGTGSVYHHLIVCHLEAILDANQPHGLNSLASDQSLEAAHGMVKNIAAPLGLPGNQQNPSLEGNKQDHWEENNRRILARFNKSTYDRVEFKNLSQACSKPQLPSDEKLIAAFV